MRYDGHFFARHVFLPPVAAALLLGALCGCGKLAVQHPGEGHGGPVGSVEIVVENFVGEAGSLRTIAPDQLTANQLAGAGYRLELTGTTGRQTLPPRTLTLVNGRAALGDIPVGLWELTLRAYDSGNNVAVLQGKATHQVRQAGSGEVSFLLTPAGLADTGTLNLTVSWQEADRQLLQSSYTAGGLRMSMALYNREDGSMIPGTEAIWTRSNTNTAIIPTTLTYNGGPSAGTFDLAAGEYELRFSATGGGLPAGTTLVWMDNLYIEPGRQTTGTVTIPQLAHKPAAPAGLYSTASSHTNTYDAVLTWKDVYNADSYVVEVKSFTTGNWKTFNQTTWNGLGGGATYTYTAAAWSPNGAPVYRAGSLKGDSDSFTVRITRSANQHWVARIRAVNSYGSSDWTYLTNLLNPLPSITGVVTSAGKPATNQVGYRHFDVTRVTVNDVDYEQSYQVEVYRLEKLDGTKVNFADVNFTEGWNDNMTNARVISKSGMTATNIAFPSLAEQMEFCMRIRAVSSRGDSPWSYWGVPVKKS